MPMPDGYDPSEYEPYRYESVDPAASLPDYVENALYDTFSLITISAMQNLHDLGSGVMIVKAKSGSIWSREEVLIGTGV